LVELLERYRPLVFVVLFVLVLGSLALLANDRLSEDDAPILQQSDPAYQDIRVYVAGAVQSPGIYRMEDGSRWGDAVTAAGGFSADANYEAVNLARRVQDEDHIVVPRLVGAVTTEQGNPNGLVNINSASELDLISLPGIGEARAADIVRSRTQDGPFGVTEDLVSRELIPDSVYQDIVALITVSR
jgi:competence protein ComEA